MTRSDSSATWSSMFRVERARLLDVLQSLDPSDWPRPTRCPGWSVHALALHLVGDDLSILSWQRDHHYGTPAPASLDGAGFIAWIDALQIDWVHAARRISPRLAVEILRWLDGPIADTIEAQDPAAVDANVSWAGNHQVPRWLDQARELSERWIHRQQILEALGRPADLNQDLLRPILDAFQRAYLFRLGAVRRPSGCAVTVAVTGPEVTEAWTMVSDGAQWNFDTASADRVIGGLAATTDQAWRLLTNNLAPSEHGMPTTFGDDEITEVLRRTRAVIGEPK